MNRPDSNRALDAHPVSNLKWRFSSPLKNGCSAMLLSSVSMFVLPLPRHGPLGAVFALRFHLGKNHVCTGGPQSRAWGPPPVPRYGFFFPASLCRMARASSVISMATGHHVMQRPHPTQPEVPNWSIQVASLCVIHCRYRDLAEARTLPP